MLQAILSVLQKAVSTAWTPAQLFASGEQGVWYDPSDLTSMYTDRAGTVSPSVIGTVADQTIGKVNDKSGRGNHAVAPSDAARPLLSARVNLLTYSEDFTNVLWSKNGATIVSNVIVSPVGTTTVDFVKEDTSSGNHSAAYNYLPGWLLGAPLYFSFYAPKYGQANSRQWFYAAILSGSNPQIAYRYIINVDAATGTITDSKVGANLASCSTTITSVGDFWWVKMVCTPSTTSTTLTYVIAGASNSATPTYNATYGDIEYTGNGTSGQYFWGMQMSTAAQVYQAVVTASNYDATGFPAYLKFDGVDDVLIASAIPRATGVFSSFVGGLTNLVSRTVTFASADNYNTSPTLRAPQYLLVGSGVSSTLVFNTSTTPFGDNGPAVAINTAFVETALATTTTLDCRVNGVSTGVTGITGPLTTSALPLHVGGPPAAVSNLFLQGNIYTLINREALTSAGDVTSAEQWCATKAGVTL